MTISIRGKAESAEAFISGANDYIPQILALEAASPTTRAVFESVARIIREACDQLSDVPALVEAVEAAHAYYAVDWDGESEERLALALAAFSFGDRDDT